MSEQKRGLPSIIDRLEVDSIDKDTNPEDYSDILKALHLFYKLHHESWCLNSSAHESLINTWRNGDFPSISSEDMATLLFSEELAIIMENRFQIDMNNSALRAHEDYVYVDNINSALDDIRSLLEKHKILGISLPYFEKTKDVVNTIRSSHGYIPEDISSFSEDLQKAFSVYIRAISGLDCDSLGRRAS